MTHNAPTTTGNVLPPGAKLCAGLWNGADCDRRHSCARYVEIETTPGAAMVWPAFATRWAPCRGMWRRG